MDAVESASVLDFRTLLAQTAENMMELLIIDLNCVESARDAMSLK